MKKHKSQGKKMMKEKEMMDFGFANPKFPKKKYVGKGKKK